MMIKSSLSGFPELNPSKPCRWLDNKKYFQWKGEMLINADGEFLSINEGMIMDDFPTPPHANSIRFIYILELQLRQGATLF